MVAVGPARRCAPRPIHQFRVRLPVAAAEHGRCLVGMGPDGIGEQRTAGRVLAVDQRQHRGEVVERHCPPFDAVAQAAIESEATGRAVSVATCRRTMANQKRLYPRRELVEYFGRPAASHLIPPAPRRIVVGVPDLSLGWPSPSERDLLVEYRDLRVFLVQGFEKLQFAACLLNQVIPQTPSNKLHTRLGAIRRQPRPLMLVDVRETVTNVFHFGGRDGDTAGGKENVITVTLVSNCPLQHVAVVKQHGRAAMRIGRRVRDSERRQ